MHNSTQKLEKLRVYLLRGSFDFENGLVCPTEAIGSISKGVYPLRGSFDHENRQVSLFGPTSSITKRFYPLRGSFDFENGPVYLSGPIAFLSEGVYLHRDLFDLENWSFFPSRPTNFIEKVLTDVPKIYWQKWHHKSGSPKDPWTKAHENPKNKGLTRSEICLTLKMGRFSHRDYTNP
ncbi:hypothetical protein H5410_056523 [Solanum commersonii]|uniref:Uncharacterized protein n=1 Tax=Solanum commersonii TaxID=4109 RepID=A0A9J5WLY8_SOLCO|nr:hypothetical protein H5410_056523 [Solanum commersonii]